MAGRRFVVAGAWGVLLIGALSAACLIAAGRVAPEPAQAQTLAELPLDLRTAILATVERDHPAGVIVQAQIQQQQPPMQQQQRQIPPQQLKGQPQPLQIQQQPPYIQQHQFVPTGGTVADRFGYSIALSANGTVALVGALPVGPGRGSVYVFTRVGGTWTGRPLTASASHDNDGYGASVALSAAGDTAIVGATRGETFRGSAFVFTGVANQWIQQQQLECARCAANDLFGSAVALSAGGGVALIGLPGFQGSRGAAVVFTRSAGQWSQLQGIDAAGEVANDEFGKAVALSSDGNTALVGAHGVAGRTGAAYVFMRTGVSTWTKQKLTAADGAANGFFGWDVAISGNGGAAIVGANRLFDRGAAYVFGRSGNSWTQQQKFTSAGGNAYNLFGTSVSMSTDGATVLVGANDVAASKGVAFGFTASGGSWTQRQITAAGGMNNDRFGASVAVSGDGLTALFGAVGVSNARGAGYVFARGAGATWVQQQQLGAVGFTPGFGAAAVVSADGNTALIGAPGEAGNHGALYVFGRSGGTWNQLQQYPGLQDNGYFGFSIALSADGNTAISIPLVLTRSGASWAVQGQLPTIGPVPRTYSDPQGQAVISLSPDGNTALVGKATHSVNAQGYHVIDRGTAFVFARQGSAWMQQAQLDPGPASPAFALGHAVALSADGNTAVVGAPGTMYTRSHETASDPRRNGAVYVFSRPGSGGNWTLLQTLTPTDSAPADRFGDSVAVSSNGGQVLVGAAGVSGFRGAAYMFVRPAAGPWPQWRMAVAEGAPDDDFGYTVAMTPDGATALIGAVGMSNARGAVYVFGRSGSGWVLQERLVGPAAAGQFGGTLSVTPDGKSALIGPYFFAR